MKKSVIDVVVIGAGAAGLMAAITAAKSGNKVLVLEHNEVAGKKILATGNGRCNFTNILQGEQYYRCESPDFVMSVLNQFGALDTITFFQQLGVMTVEKNGYYYPRTMQASLVRESLLRECTRLGIQIIYGIGIRSIKKENNVFLFDTKSGLYYSKSCVLATGGKADPKSGSDGSGYIYAKQLGHSVTTTVPALVPLVCEGEWLKEVKGVRQEARVTIFVDKQPKFSDWGEVQFTDYGVSGIPVFQISRFATRALAENKGVSVEIDFLPDLSKDDLIDWLRKQIQNYRNHSTIVEVMAGMVNHKLASALSKKIAFSNQYFGALSEKQMQMLITQAVAVLKETKLRVIDSKNFLQAQVTCGGVVVDEIFQGTMESKLVNGLFFAGEIVDVDGMCGGYNLQWAWSSGYVAGTHANKR